MGDESYPQTLSEDYLEDDNLLRKVHRALFELDVVTGQLLCCSCDKKYYIKNGILGLCHENL